MGTPNIMEISLDMMATMYVAAADGEKSIYELSDFAADTLVTDSSGSTAWPTCRWPAPCSKPRK